MTDTRQALAAIYPDLPLTQQEMHALNITQQGRFDASGEPYGWQVLSGCGLIAIDGDIGEVSVGGIQSPRLTAMRRAALSAQPVAGAVAEPRTLLEQFDLDQSPDYRKGYEDGRQKGFEVGHRYATERAQAAPAPEPSAQAGWKLVPVEPTDAMIDATYHGQPLADIWHDMLAASPEPSAQGEPVAWRPNIKCTPEQNFNAGLPNQQTIDYWKNIGCGIEYAYSAPSTPPPAVVEYVPLMRGARVEGETVVISVKGGNDAARKLCGELVTMIERWQKKGNL